MCVCLRVHARIHVWKLANLQELVILSAVQVLETDLQSSGLVGGAFPD